MLSGVYPLKEAALIYASKGYPVFPIIPRGKSPLTKHGYKDASLDAEVIRLWWTAYPNANIAIPTGDASGFWVLDIDSPEGEAWLEKQGALPSTPCQRTSKGRHLFFRWPESQIVASSQKRIEGIDSRGEGGYVVVSPSIHPNGDTYQWLHSLLELPLVFAPPSILAPFTKEKQKLAPLAPLAPLKLQTRLAGTSDGLNRLSKACHAIANAPNGNQQATLNAQAFAMGRLVRRGKLHPANAYHALYQAALAMPSYSRPWREKDIQKIISRALRDAMTHP